MKRHYELIIVGAGPKLPGSWPGLVDEVYVFNRGLSAAESRDWKNIAFRSEAEERSRVKRFSAD